MLILAVDTTAKAASCALWRDGVTAASCFERTGVTHSVTLMPMIEHVMSCAGVDISQIEMFAATTGPGSFTGVRIGASCILGLALGRGVPCVGVSTLDALAANFTDVTGDFIICPVMDARRSQFYNALYSSGAQPIRLTEDRAISAEELLTELAPLKKPVMLCGDGARIASSLLGSLPLLPVPALLEYQTAPSVASAAYRRYINENDKSVFTDIKFKPTYLRPSQAERKSNQESPV